MSGIVVFDHPLIKHKITLLRDCSTGTRDFRILIEEIATLMGYEAQRPSVGDDGNKNSHRIHQSSRFIGQNNSGNSYFKGGTRYGQRIADTCSYG